MVSQITKQQVSSEGEKKTSWTADMNQRRFSGSFLIQKLSWSFR